MAECSWTKRVETSKSKDEIIKSMTTLGYSYTKSLEIIDNYENQNALILRLLTISSAMPGELNKVIAAAIESPKRVRTQLNNKLNVRMDSILVIPKFKNSCLKLRRRTNLAPIKK